MVAVAQASAHLHHGLSAARWGETILGYTPAEWIADPTAWYEWVHPDDRAMVIAENKRCEQTAEAYVMERR